MSIRILVDDDDLVSKIDISKILKDNFKYLNLFTAKNFIETISLVSETIVDLIILDIKSSAGACKKKSRYNGSSTEY